MIEVDKLITTSGEPMPFGVSFGVGYIQISIWCKGCRKCRLHLYEKRKKIGSIKMNSMKEYGMADVFSIRILDEEATKRFDGMEYLFETEQGEQIDPYAREISGRTVFGKQKKLMAKFCFSEFDWTDESRKAISFQTMVMYQCHVRGFTKHPSSGVKHPGTFDGMAEKIPYLKRLGVNTLLLLPIYDFNELDEKITEFSDGKRMNYWGYTKDAFYFAPKAAYCSGIESPKVELCRLVKRLHNNRMNLVLDMHFEGKTPDFILECLRYYVLKFHVDGFLINQNIVAAELVMNDPVLRHVKLFGTGWDERAENGIERLGEFNDGFLVDARRFLKSDEGMVNPFYQRFRKQGTVASVVNYLTQKNGFTLMDLVSYDVKHNEANSERNNDGTEYNYSWNCGAEGTTRKKGVLRIRRQQIKNGLIMLLLSMGTPMILAGDEFGNSQKGNNNAYCQDNLTTWLDWRNLEKNHDIYDFARKLLQFRKKQTFYHSGTLQGLDYKGIGAPDISCHGSEPWNTNFVNYCREMGVLFYGSYFEEEKSEVSVYIGFNMHWEPHEFFLPLDKKWEVIVDTSEKKRVHQKEAVDGKYVLDPRTVVVFSTIQEPKNTKN